ncbi:AAA family ATPase [Bacillus sp. BF9-10]|uniref:AAA family ATPase n=1 Tax=Bacillus sp. BF9-10 TaxID=2217822 RepID=UPI0015D3DCDD|nr:AAA family ATPase [Bacillus sp. BF9-10]
MPTLTVLSLFFSRRILENYFKFLGGIELDDLVEHFEEDEKLIVSSLINWTYDGSHHIQEDLYVQQPSELNEKIF